MGLERNGAGVPVINVHGSLDFLLQWLHRATQKAELRLVQVHCEPEIPALHARIWLTQALMVSPIKGILWRSLPLRVWWRRITIFIFRRTENKDKEENFRKKKTKGQIKGPAGFRTSPLLL